MKLLCTDLDRTLLPNGDESESPAARPVLWHLLQSHAVALAYVSGRDLARILKSVQQYELQKPDVIVADVGTSVYVRDGEGWLLQEAWQLQIADDWNGLDSEDMRELLASFNELEDQEADRQTRFKRSYYLPRELDTENLKLRLEELLAGQGIKASLVFSDDPQKNVQLLDVLPLHATKVDAIRHVQKLLEVDNEQTLFSGDSGNDVTALASEIPSVTVRNADLPTREAVRRLAALNATEASSYQAEGALSLAGGRALNGNYAAGIVEGLVHFNSAWSELLDSEAWVAKALELYALQGEAGSLQA
ncbi:HAD-IIB family hydrolase [Granulosicoccus antarcticus]|uniref:Sucrose phosphatase-like domain-containing protein n=1 Tax=Granulosicoccus antarcticus IMCC3135 TaxID=1192854 RepID=A0A2Z2NPA7_9GAMM|nr:HAD-IIB family hydrolase [Granulosicoccus antarcticus]ASJ71498.1 hypothetical protein IMCC3135_06960 [Granulosicoccus antarcticus IMCC3135]